MNVMVIAMWKQFVMRQPVTQDTSLYQQEKGSFSHDMKNAVVVAGSVWKSTVTALQLEMKV
jgi:hypothetical protein